jgi:hypothetical protein
VAFISLDSPSCEVPCWILRSVVYRDVTQQAKGLYRLKHEVALKRGLAYLSRCNSGWFCHSLTAGRGEKARVGNGAVRQGVIVDIVWLEATVHGRQWFVGVEEGTVVLLRMLREQRRRKTEGTGMIQS